MPSLRTKLGLAIMAVFMQRCQYTAGDRRPQVARAALLRVYRVRVRGDRADYCAVTKEMIVHRCPRTERDRSVFKADARYAVGQCINALEMLDMNTMVEPRMTASKVLDLLFPESIDLLRAAGAIAAVFPSVDPFPLAAVIPNVETFPEDPEGLIVFMRVMWDKLKTIAPAITNCVAPPVVISQLTDMLVITRKWQRVRGVFKYLNERCRSPAGFRSTWPCIVALAPTGHSVHGVTEKNVDIPDIGAMLADIRDTQATVAGAMLLSPIETPRTYNIFVQFHEPDIYSQYFGFA